MSTRTVTASLLDITGAVQAGSTTVFRLLEPGTSGNSVYTKSTEPVVADSNGEFSVDLWPNGTSTIQSFYEVKLPDASTYRFILPSGAVSISLATLIEENAISAGTLPASSISDSTATGRAVLTAADDAAARGAIGLGSTDSVEFGDITIDQLNFPNLTISELDAVTDATAGDTYLNTDTNQFVRFNSASAYDVITSRATASFDSGAADSLIPLMDSKIQDIPEFVRSSDFNNPDDYIRIYDNNGGVLGGYYYHDDGAGTEGWLDVSSQASFHTAPVFGPNRTIVWERSIEPNVHIGFHRSIVNTTTPSTVAQATLKAGTSYKINFRINYFDLPEKLRLNFDFTGSFDAESQIVASHIGKLSKSNSAIITLDPPTSSFFFLNNEASITGLTPEKAGEWKVEGMLKASSDGLLTIGVAQNAANALPIYFSKAVLNIEALAQ